MVERAIARFARYLSEQAAVYDETGKFPHAHFDRLIEEGLHTLPLKSEYGGHGMNIEQTCRALMTMASGCPSTALTLAMHYYSLGGLDRVMLPSELKKQLFRDVADNGAYVGSIGNPHVLLMTTQASVGANIGLRAERVPGGYVVNGVKRSVSGSKRITYLPIYCEQPDAGKSTYGITALMAHMKDAGITIQDTWNYAGMRATDTHDVQFDNVFLSDERRFSREGMGIEDTQPLVYWFRLAFVSVYLGIAQAAFDYILARVTEKRDRVSAKMLAFLPGTQFAIADMKIKLDSALSQLIATARQVDREERNGVYSDDLYIQTLVAKQVVTRNACDIVWLAMEVEGMGSLNCGHLLERLYRDVRAGTFHPPSEDLVKEAIAKKILGVIPSGTRWV